MTTALLSLSGGALAQEAAATPAASAATPAAATGTPDDVWSHTMAKEGVKAGDVVEAAPGYEYVYGYEDYLEEPLAEDSTGKPDSSGKAPAASGTTTPPANGTVKQRLTRSKRVKKPTFNNKEVEFAPAAEVKFGDDIDDEGKREGGQPLL